MEREARAGVAIVVAVLRTAPSSKTKFVGTRRGSGCSQTECLRCRGLVTKVAPNIGVGCASNTVPAKPGQLRLNWTRLGGTGRASFDPDGGALSFSWTGAFTPSPAIGATPAVTFPEPIGAKIINLLVTDLDALTDSCTADVTVQDTLAPSLTTARRQPCRNPEAESALVPG